VTEKADADRVVHLEFEADDEFLADMERIREETRALLDRQYEEQRQAIERFRQRLFKEGLH
jgi:hypothetical protein